MSTTTVTTPMTADERIAPLGVESGPIATRPVMRGSTQQAAAAPVAEGGLPLSYRHSEQFGELMMALAVAQGAFQDIEKNQSANVQSKRDGARSYTYEYADLAAIMASVRPALSENAIAMVQMPSVRRGAVIVTTMIVHGQSQQWFAVDLAVALDTLDPQAVGSATTYARRYGVTSLLGLAAFDRDDDGAGAGLKRQQSTEEPPTGFERWWGDMETVAADGWPGFEDAWSKSNHIFKNFVTKHRPEQWKALKAKAMAVKS